MQKKQMEMNILKLMKKTSQIYYLPHKTSLQINLYF